MTLSGPGDRGTEIQKRRITAAMDSKALATRS
jgi:hypothetical protein